MNFAQTILFDGKQGKLKNTLSPMYSSFSQQFLRYNGTPIDDFRLNDVVAIYGSGRPIISVYRGG